MYRLHLQFSPARQTPAPGLPQRYKKAGSFFPGISCDIMNDALPDPEPAPGHRSAARLVIPCGGLTF